MSFEVGFCKLLNVYFNDVQINRWLHLSTNFWGFFLTTTCLEKEWTKLTSL